MPPSNPIDARVARRSCRSVRARRQQAPARLAAEPRRLARAALGDVVHGTCPRSHVRRIRPVSTRWSYAVIGFLCSSRAASILNGSSTPKTVRCAGAPTSITPTPVSPATRAGPVVNSGRIVSSGMPRPRASVQTADSPSCSPAMPPHARPKSPPPERLRSTVLGEWSLTIASIVPSTMPCPEQVAVRRSRGSADST